MFGLGGRAHAALDSSLHPELTIIPRTQIAVPVPGPGVVFITGASGSGKSTLLRLISDACERQGACVLKLNDVAHHHHDQQHAHDRMAIVDDVAPDRPLAEALELLSLAGLGDAFVLLRSPDELSDGQRFRFHVARLLAAAATHHRASESQPVLIVIDEFAAALDRVTARMLARSIRRWSDRTHIAFMLATTHDDLIDALQPDVLIRKGLGDAMAITCAHRITQAAPAPPVPPAPAAPSAAGADDYVIERGTLDDYRALSRFHYRSQHPGAATSVLRIMHCDESSPVGVLVRSLPSLNCTLRDRALHQRYATLDPRERGIVLNRELRCISRVIIDPRYRGAGLAVRLVRSALQHPESSALRYTEALAAMGRVSPFFERAGMSRFDLPVEARPAHARLLDVLHSIGVSEHQLASMTDDSCARLAADHARFNLVMREIRRFLRATRRMTTAQLASRTSQQLLREASARLGLRPVYYLFTHAASPPPTTTTTSSS